MAANVYYNGAFIGVVRAMSAGYTEATGTQATASQAAINNTADTYATAVAAASARFTPIAVAAGDYENLLSAVVEGLFAGNPSVSEFTGTQFANLVTAAVDIFNATAGQITT